jgi:Ca2+-binding RTX toxin-like protein
VVVRRLSALVSAVALGSVLVISGHSPVRAATTWSYGPDTSTDSCAGTTIQACVDAASGGDTIYVYANDAGSTLSVLKSVSVKSGDGVHHTVNSFAFSDNATPVIATVAGLSVNTKMLVYFDSTTGSSVIVRNMIAHGLSGSAALIDVDLETSATVTLENNLFTAVPNSGDGIDVLARPNGGNITFRATGNTVNLHGNPNSGVGIQLSMYSSGTVRMDVYNNSIWDVARSLSGAASGIAILPSDTVHADVNVVGNTVELSATEGIQQRNDLSSGGQLALDLFNNTFSHASVRGIDLSAGLAGTMVFRGGLDNTFGSPNGNSYDGLAKGPGNLAVDPKFVDRASGNLRLTSGSPLINKGQVCSPGGVADPDAANRHRLSGSSVDIGAFERGGPVINGLVMLGTDGADIQNGTLGADILCGYGGTDTQNGSGGNDFMDGGDAADYLIGGNGADRMLGGLGNDTLCANDGKNIDFLNGGKGDDGFKADSGDVKKSVEHAAPCT